MVMKLIICIMIAFLAVVYVYSYISYKRQKNKTIDTVAEFNEKYLKGKKTSVNKNGPTDYIERTEFIEEAHKTANIEKIKETPWG